jgi:protein-L-isoaspartate(D-aspartate) O-methyltransferase
MSVTLGPDGAEATIAFLMALRASGLRDTGVLRAFETVPRSRFVPRRFVDLALRDVALPIACGQSTIAPSLMAGMIAALDLRPEHRVLEIGAGSGYGTALMARLAAEVVAVERYRSLAIEAQARLDQQGIRNAGVHFGDGMRGWPTAAPFERILVDGAFDTVPASLIAQMAPSGRLVGVERADGLSALVRYSREDMGALRREIMAPFALPLLMSGVSEAL